MPGSAPLFVSSPRRIGSDSEVFAGFWPAPGDELPRRLPMSSSSVMLGRLFMSRSFTTDVGYCSKASLDASRSPPNLALKENLTCRAGQRFQGNVTEKRSYGNDCVRNKLWELPSTDKAQTVLIEDEEQTWEECKQLVSSLNFTIDEAGVMLGKAFGWTQSPYWGEERRKEIPRNEGVSGMLNYLRNLGLSNDDLHKLLKKFPEVLGCSLDNEVKTNISVLEKEWGIKGKTLRSLLLRNPKVLGYNVDCKGDCVAKCTRCWARF